MNRLGWREVTHAVAMLALVSLVTGCSGDSKSEVKAFVKDVKSKPTRRVEPLPQVKQYASVIYSARSLASPFTRPDTRTIVTAKVDSGLAPNMDRPPEPLEAFPLDSLKMVGTMIVGGKNSAIIRDPQGVIHSVVKGNYVGNNFGKVTEVTDTEIEINELVPDNRGGWRLRKSTIAFGE